MKTVQVNLGQRSYSIHVGEGLLGQIGSFLEGQGYSNKVLLVSNPTVSGLYEAVVRESLYRSGFETVSGIIGDGEQYKNLATVSQLYDLALEAQLDRLCPVVALGGGVVGDVAGFVAATYLRGVPFIQVPTTLMAQVDSSVGGKVGVNHPKGKNIIGAFYQPQLVLADVATLQTLPARQIATGLAEVIKYGAIKDESFFTWLENNMPELLLGNRDVMIQAVETSCRIKAGVVEEDERENELRAILNFGHTIGHALETLTEYRTFTHGEAIAIGMVAAANLAQLEGLLAPVDSRRVVSLISSAGLPVEIPAGFAVDRIMENLKHDKKIKNGRLTLVLLERIGQYCLRRGIPEEDIKKVVAGLIKV
ncbi:MAG: 3-dehydroquinate synthase [Pelotomaculum sp.]|jgi:3-dehydroquinate synthase